MPRAGFVVPSAGAPAADAIAQEAFVAAIRTLDRFGRRRPFGPWLGRIVASRAIDWTRPRAARREVGTEASPEPGSERPATGYSDEIVAALAALSPEHRVVVVMRFV